MTKTEQKRLLSLCKSHLQARTNYDRACASRCATKTHMAHWHGTYDKLHAYCTTHGVDTDNALDQARAFLRRTSIAACMNGIV